MTLKELKDTDWYKERPAIIKEAIDSWPPIVKYKIKHSGHQCVIVGYTEPDENCNEVTAIVQKTGIGSPFPEMNMYQVFGVKKNELEMWGES